MQPVIKLELILGLGMVGSVERVGQSNSLSSGSHNTLDRLVIVCYNVSIELNKGGRG